MSLGSTDDAERRMTTVRVYEAGDRRAISPARSNRSECGGHQRLLINKRGDRKGGNLPRLLQL